jgi:hypothetical protein
MTTRKNSQFLTVTTLSVCLCLLVLAAAVGLSVRTISHTPNGRGSASRLSDSNTIEGIVGRLRNFEAFGSVHGVIGENRNDVIGGFEHFTLWFAAPAVFFGSETVKAVEGNVVNSFGAHNAFPTCSRHLSAVLTLVSFARASI